MTMLRRALCQRYFTRLNTCTILQTRAYARRSQKPFIIMEEFEPDFYQEGDWFDIRNLMDEMAFSPKRSKSRRTERDLDRIIMQMQEEMDEDNEEMNENNEEMNEHDNMLIQQVVKLLENNDRAKKVFGKINPDLVHNKQIADEECNHESCNGDHSVNKAYSFQFIGSKRMRKGSCIFNCQVMHDPNTLYKVNEELDSSAILTISRVFVRYGSKSWDFRPMVDNCQRLDANGVMRNLDVIDVEVESK